MGACNNCSTKCLLIHGKKDDLGSTMRSFFKIMIHDNFSDILGRLYFLNLIKKVQFLPFLPPKFARGLTSLANKKIQIKDRSGNHWTVLLSYVDGHLAFGQGWRAFALNHGIEFGDIVTVRYISGSDFICQIYGRNGCDKWQFPSPSHNKTSLGSANKHLITYCNSTVNVDITQSIEEGSSTECGKGVKRNFFEDPCCSINRDIGSAPTVDRRSFFDLSEFEMCKNKPICENVGSLIQDGGCSDHAQREEQISESSFVENIVNFSAFEQELSLEVLSTTLDAQTTTLRDQGKKHNANVGLQENGVSSSYQVSKKVKAEVVDLIESPSPLSVTCLVTSDDNFLVMPKDFSSLGDRTNMDLEKKVVLLRDSARILWPILCFKKYNVQVLATGWKSFRKANRIRTGDECVFELEDESEGIFHVNVVRK